MAHPAFLGTTAAVLITDPVVTLPEASRIPRPSSKGGGDNQGLPIFLIGIFIIILIFIVVISIYDVIKERLVVWYTEAIVQNPDVVQTPEQAAKMRIEAHASYSLSMCFSMIAITIAVIFLPILFVAYYVISKK